MYTRSSRGYPRSLLRVEPPLWAQAINVDKDGFVRWQRRRVFVSTALAHEIVQLERVDEHRWSVSFGAILLGHVDQRRPTCGLSISRRRRGDKQVSTLSLESTE